MVGDENILVEYDYQNIIIVDPNKIVDTEGNVKERAIKHENLVYYASLECQLLPRTRLAVGVSNLEASQNVKIASVNFLAPAGEQFLKNSFYDEFTGEKNSKGEIKYNQQKSGIDSVKGSDNTTEYYLKQSTSNNYDTGLLGMKSINVSINSAGFSEVSIELEDIRGRALFEKGEESPYAAFFNLPYPVFYLTLKGYLGQAIKYQLSLLSFNAAFNTDTGNYTISLKFISYKYNVLTSINIGSLQATPYMYGVTYNISKDNQTPVQEGSKDVVSKPTTKGQEKISQVYSEYKSRRLVDQDLPELTVKQLSLKLSRLEKNILESFGQEEFGPVTDYDNYTKTLQDYNGEIFYYGNSWKSTYLNEKNAFIEKGTGKKIYTFKDEFLLKQTQAIDELKTIIDKYNKLLESNPTFGKNGTYKISGKEYSSDIPINITTGNTQYNKGSLDIDYEQSYLLQKSRQPTAAETATFSANSQNKLFNSVSSGNTGINYTWFCFEGKDRFIDLTSQIQNTLQKISEEIDKKLSESLAQQIQKKDNGLGFKPTIRNICGIIMANAEAYLRLMNDVHLNAWNARDSQVKRQAVLGQTTVTNPDNIDGSQDTPIYPWPQFFIETDDNDNEKFKLKYPGESDIVNKTMAYNYEIWPEVQFVEEYIKGLTALNEEPNIDTLESDVGVIERISLNTLDYYPSNIIFTNKEEVKFFYEIYERVFLSPFYQRFNKKFVLESQLSEVVSESETLNLIKALGVSSPYLISKLKQYALNSEGYKQFLKSISNDGTGESWQKFIRDEFVTPYISEEVNKSFSLELPIDNSQEKSVQPSLNNSDKLQSFLSSTKTNETDITDTYPFTIPNWYKTNLANGNTSNQKDIYNTTKVLVFNPTFKMLSNFTDVNTTPKPFVTKIINNPVIINQGYVGIKDFYIQRKITDFLPTEGFVYYNDYLGNANSLQTTSIFNTPYFHNAISEGVFNLKSNNNNPFVSAAYLFLNSLPLATLREKYVNSESQQLDYIFATLKKFGAVHNLPYAWILKYGSIWYRYKKYVQDNIDILDFAWSDFNYSYFYDPLTSNPQKQYVVTANSLNNTITLEQTTSVVANSLVEMNLGFYPLLINNYHYLFNNSDLFTLFTNQEINDNLTNGKYTLNICDTSIINKQNGYNPSTPNQSLKITPWVVTVKSGSDKQFIIPSFGSNVNQLNLELFKPDGTLLISPQSNNSVFNGSIRGFLSSSHFGYFDNSQLDRPTPDKYIKNIFPDKEQQEPFSLNKQSGYVNIEDMFGVFNKEILDLFEKEFLKFSQSMFDYTTDFNEYQPSSNLNNIGIKSDPSPQLKNFQMLMIEMMGIKTVPFTNSSDFIKNISTSQQNQLVNTINSFLNLTVTFKYGNPSDYNRRVFDSFSTVNTIEDKITFGPYIPNTLPGDGSTLAQSEFIYPESWKTLRTYFGNPDIPNLKYTNTGSTITDFFIDNNIEFTPLSIATLYPLIKIYATQKIIQTNYNGIKFVNDINDYINNGNTILNNVLNSFLQSVRKQLPDITETPEAVIISSDTGTQNKLELWETFKSFNDAWVAGTDYSQTLLFEDLLFLDRGNRDVGDLILVDPFKIATYFNNMNLSASTYSYISTILETHHMPVQILPAYVNYYNIIDGSDGTEAFVDSTTEFGNNLFGTFLSVDTRKSSPKMIARYSEPGSKYLSSDPVKNPNFKFKSDSIELTKSSDNTLVDNLNGKTDWSKSNRVVGFNVDIGIRNQNVFKSFSVSQELGKQTTESLIALDSSVSQSSGRKSTTQNVSLYNFYKNRSYKCNVTSMGNAMIQPTMYFNLRHVPMFNGPYLIMNVKHTITSAGFVTNFEGVRQSIFSLPKITDYIQSITGSILKSLKERRKEANSSRAVSTSVQNSISQLNKGYVTNTQTLSQSSTQCDENLVENYKSYIRLNGTVSQFNGSNNAQTYFSVNQFKQSLSGVTDTKVNKYIFVLSYIESFNGTQFNSFNNNFSGIRLDKKNPPELGNKYFKQCYSCQNQSNNSSVPYAVFENISDFVEFMSSFLNNKLNNYNETSESIVEFYFKQWIQSGVNNETFNKFKETTEYQNFKKIVDNALTLQENV